MKPKPLTTDPLCACGCGQTTNEKQPGLYSAYIRGHRTRKGDYITAAGYAYRIARDHPRKSDGNYVFVHILMAEKALGRYLKPGEVVHHIDGNKLNNVNSNLVICPSESYHQLLHMNQEALDACGDANRRKCKICKKWDHIANLAAIHRKGRKNSYYYRHRQCHTEAEKLRKQKLL
jgi:hypothetical protein